ncbi:MAG: hypothetical protein QM601_03105 [Pseudoxanthomonas sp.]
MNSQPQSTSQDFHVSQRYPGRASSTRIALMLLLVVFAYPFSWLSLRRRRSVDRPAGAGAAAGHAEDACRTRARRPLRRVFELNAWADPEPLQEGRALNGSRTCAIAAHALHA